MHNIVTRTVLCRKKKIPELWHAAGTQSMTRNRAVHWNESMVSSCYGARERSCGPVLPRVTETVSARSDSESGSGLAGLARNPSGLGIGPVGPPFFSFRVGPLLLRQPKVQRRGGRGRPSRSGPLAVPAADPSSSNCTVAWPALRLTDNDVDADAFLSEIPNR